MFWKWFFCNISQHNSGNGTYYDFYRYGEPNWYPVINCPKLLLTDMSCYELAWIVNTWHRLIWTAMNCYEPIGAVMNWTEYSSTRLNRLSIVLPEHGCYRELVLNDMNS